MEKNEEGQLQTRVEKVAEVFSGETAKTNVSLLCISIAIISQYHLSFKINVYFRNIQKYVAFFF